MIIKASVGLWHAENKPEAFIGSVDATRAFVDVYSCPIRAIESIDCSLFNTSVSSLSSEPTPQF